MIDLDLADLYGVTTSRLNEQVTRNRKRFLFRLTKEEAGSLRSQFAISNAGRGGRRYLQVRLRQMLETNVELNRQFVDWVQEPHRILPISPY